VEGERPKSHVAMRLALDHLTDRVDLVGGELRRNASQATWTIVKRAILYKFGPSMIAGRREAQDAQSNRERDGLLSVGDRGQDRPLGIAVGHPLGVEAKPGQSYKPGRRAE
jgi:hypothetical protein